MHFHSRSQAEPQDPFMDFAFANEDENEDQAFLTFLTANEDSYGDHASFFRDQSRRLRSFEPDYKPEYTHPGKAAPGFTYDFEPTTSPPPPSSNSVIVIDDSPGPSTKAGSSSSSHSDDTNEILVCAHCTDPLVTGDSVTGGEERLQKRVWALRCGHVLDGKCIDALMKPAPSEGQADLNNSPGNSKGKGKAIETTQEQQNTINILSVSNTNSIRSRLRPRSGTSFNQSGTPLAALPRSYRPIPYRRSQGGRGKGKGKVQAPIIQAEYHWKCPVAGCGKDHTSWLVEDKWVPHDKEGAITVYV